MSLKTGIIGLPNVGKSSLFQALTKKSVEAANYAFTTINPNIATVKLLDKRLDNLANLVKPLKVINATLDFVDIAGLVKGASRGEGLGNQFLANIREVDALVHVLRCFQDKEIIHVFDSIDPVRDLEIINLELILADLSSVQKMLDKKKTKALQTNNKELKMEYHLLLKVLQHLKNEQSVRTLNLDSEEKKIIKNWQLLSAKPQIYVANIASNVQERLNLKNLEAKIKEEKAELIYLAIDLQKELSTLDQEEKASLMALFETKEESLVTLVRAAFKLLNLATYFTVGKKEVRSWIFKKGMSAPEGAAIIHSDFYKNFIKAEIITYEDFCKFGSELKVKENGKMRLEGKTYLLADGDICHFKINQSKT